MADYKVPQDVEADDKLIGPFSFRQFVYLIIVAMAIAIAWGLSNIFVGLAIIPLPIIIFFGALALPLRKDQPMEIYMAAIVSFYLKPRLRRWDPEGIESLIEITAPKTVDIQRTKDLSQLEAEQRISYLADIVDTQGWAIRGVSGTGGVVGTAMNTDIFLEAQETEDILDTNNYMAQNFGQLMAESTERMREEAKQRMMEASFTPEPALQVAQQTYQPPAPVYPPQMQVQYQPQIQPQPQYQPQAQIQQPQYQPQPPATPIAQAYSPNPTPQAPFTQFTPSGAPVQPTEPVIEFNPYPTNIRQSVIQPISEPAAEPINIPTPPEAATPQPTINTAPPQTLDQPTTIAEPATLITEQQTVKATPKPELPKTPTKTTNSKKTVQNSSSKNKPSLKAKPNTSGNRPSTDIINLANNPDLSIKTIAHEANRLNSKSNDDSGEVVISLR